MISYEDKDDDSDSDSDDDDDDDHDHDHDDHGNCKCGTTPGIARVGANMFKHAQASKSDADPKKLICSGEWQPPRDLNEYQLF